MKIDLGKIGTTAIGLLAGAVLALGVVTMRNRETVAPVKIVPPEPTPTLIPTMTPAPIQVFVSGEVLAPDVYALAPGSRIKQLVEAAGGFTDKANAAVVNLAQPLTDGAHVHVPAEDDLVATPESVLTNPAPLRSPGEIDLSLGGDLVNINNADLYELDTLPGIGPVTAQKILDYRAVNGPFIDTAAIMEVSGIGQTRYDQIKALITAGSQQQP